MLGSTSIVATKIFLVSISHYKTKESLRPSACKLSTVRVPYFQFTGCVYLFNESNDKVFFLHSLRQRDLTEWLIL